MSPFTFKNRGTNDEVTFDFADIRLIRHDHAQSDVFVNVHVIDQNLKRHMFVITDADYLDMCKWAYVENRAREGFIERLPPPRPLSSPAHPATDGVTFAQARVALPLPAETEKVQWVQFQFDPGTPPVSAEHVTELLRDFIANGESFVYALEQMKAQVPNAARAGYWQHQIDVLRTMLRKAKALKSGGVE